MMPDMSLKEIEARLEEKIKDLDALIHEANEKRHMDTATELLKSRSRLVAKLADVRVTHATIH